MPITLVPLVVFFYLVYDDVDWSPTLVIGEGSSQLWSAASGHWKGRIMRLFLIEYHVTSQEKKTDGIITQKTNIFLMDNVLFVPPLSSSTVSDNCLAWQFWTQKARTVHSDIHAVYSHCICWCPFHLIWSNHRNAPDHNISTTNSNQLVPQAIPSTQRQHHADQLSVSSSFLD